MKAHITRTENGEVVNQTVAEHCKNVANYAAEIMGKVGMPTVGYVAGLYHDIGKNKKFEEYLERAFNGEPVKRGSVNHTFAGVAKILSDFHNSDSRAAKYLSEIIAFSVGSHHAMFDMGIVDKKDWENTDDISGVVSGIGRRYCYFNDGDKRQEYVAVLDYFEREICSDTELNILWQDALREFQLKYSDFCKAVGLGVYGTQKQSVLQFFIQCLMRHLLSTVVEGDRRDTKEFMEQKKVTVKKMDWALNMQYFNDKFNLFDTNTVINAARRQISDILYNQEVKPSGVYLLTLPTGSGKTLSAVRYALKIANECNKDRIFYVAPLLSILQQNAVVLKRYLAEKNLVLEHYSDILQDKEGIDEFIDYAAQKYGKETWDSSFIITTLYQILETFFKDGLTSVRRFNRLTNSVLIIDEVQQVPTTSIQLFNLMINYLADYCNVTVILMTATQPHFELSALTYPVHITGDLTRTISTVVDLDNVFGNRVNYDVDLRPITYNEQVVMLKRLSEQNKSVLLICNTRTTCRSLFDLCKKLLSADIKLYRLSRNMCEAEISDTLSSLRRSLEKKERVVCISTQLIEAGVDITFEAVVRASAGLDNVIQAAGRCNRHNTMDRKGIVYVRKLRDEYINSLPDINNAQKALGAMVVDNGFELTDEYSKNYYKSFYIKSAEYLKAGTTGDRLIDNAVGPRTVEQGVNLTGFLINNHMKTFGERYTVYESGAQVTVLVPYGGYVSIVEGLKTERDIDVVTRTVKALGRVGVTMYETALKRYELLGVIKKYELDSQHVLYISDVVDFESCGGKENV